MHCPRILLCSSASRLVCVPPRDPPTLCCGTCISWCRYSVAILCGPVSPAAHDSFEGRALFIRVSSKQQAQSSTLVFPKLLC